jgi:hypothetical protein
MLVLFTLFQIWRNSILEAKAERGQQRNQQQQQQQKQQDSGHVAAQRQQCELETQQQDNQQRQACDDEQQHGPQEPQQQQQQPFQQWLGAEGRQWQWPMAPDAFTAAASEAEMEAARCSSECVVIPLVEEQAQQFLMIAEQIMRRLPGSQPPAMSQDATTDATQRFTEFAGQNQAVGKLLCGMLPQVLLSVQQVQVQVNHLGAGQQQVLALVHTLMQQQQQQTQQQQQHNYAVLLSQQHMMQTLQSVASQQSTMHLAVGELAANVARYGGSSSRAVQPGMIGRVATAGRAGSSKQTKQQQRLDASAAAAAAAIDTAAVSAGSWQPEPGQQEVWLPKGGTWERWPGDMQLATLGGKCVTAAPQVCLVTCSSPPRLGCCQHRTR